MNVESTKGLGLSAGLGRDEIIGFARLAIMKLLIK